MDFSFIIIVFIVFIVAFCCCVETEGLCN